MLLAGDIGATKTDLAIYAVESGPRCPLAQTQVRTADYPSLQAVVGAFLDRVDVSVDTGSFAVAGPVIAGHVKATNVPWVMDERELAHDLKLSAVHVMNDLEAVARAVPLLRSDDLVSLNTGEAAPLGPIGVLAPGTGLGESFLTWDGSQYLAHCSEGGHADFAPTDERQLGLLRYLWRRFDHVAVERVCSGIGVPNIYDYLREVEQLPEPCIATQSIAAASDRTRAIVDAAMDSVNPSALCRAAIDVFVAILGSEAGNLFLKVFATGGIYLAGGLARRLVQPLQDAKFMEAFRRKGRFADLMDRVPLHVITTQPALIGAAAYGLANAGPAVSRSSS